MIQPSREGFILDKFQAEASSRAQERKKHLILFDKGLGKTVICVHAMYHIRPKRVLIWAPKNAVRTWVDHICTWFRALDHINNQLTSVTIHRVEKNNTKATARVALWAGREWDSNVNVYIVTPGAFLRDPLPGVYDLVIIDEVQRLGGRDSKGFKKMVPLCRDAKYVWPVTGHKKHLPPDFWAWLHLIDHTYFTSYWRFVRTFMYTQKDPFTGALEVIGLKNKDSWFRTLRQYASIVTKEMVGKASPRRQLLRLQLDKDQSKIYRDLERDMISQTSSTNLLITPNPLSRTTRYRQLLVCPKILDPTLSYGTAIEDFGEEFKESPEEHIVLFTPFTGAIPFFQEYLDNLIKGRPFIPSLKGGMSPDALHMQIERWRKIGGPIIVSLLYAQAFSLEPASRAYFIGYDWDPENNNQAEARLDRRFTPYPLNYYYYTFENTYDDRLAEIVNIKQIRINMTTPIEKVALL